MYNVVVSSNFSLMHALVWPFKLKLLLSCFYHWYDRDIIGSWSNDDGDRRQWERKKGNKCRLAKQQLCTCITFFQYISLPSLHDYDVKMPHIFTFYGRREHNTMTFFFFSWTSIQSLRIQLQRKLPTLILINWTRWNMRDKVWSRVTLLFEWDFHSHRCHCCLSSLKNHVDAKWKGWPMQVPILPISTLLKLYFHHFQHLFEVISPFLFSRPKQRHSILYLLHSFVFEIIFKYWKSYTCILLG